MYYKYFPISCDFDRISQFYLEITICFTYIFFNYTMYMYRECKIGVDKLKCYEMNVEHVFWKITH